jgi:tRNA(Ile)-lysidine synthase
MGLIDDFREHIRGLALPRGSAVVAVSGGPDSVALLDLLVRSRDIHGLSLIVAHVDHGIHPRSAPVAQQVRSLANEFGLPLEIGQLSLGAGAGETLARAERYAWLELVRSRRGADFIFTAHHADDQVETVLMRILSGSGPAGLAGMASIRGHVVRPLLQFHREDLAHHLKEVGLSAWLDPANADWRHLRSWIRTGVLPFLRQRIPAVDANLERVSVQAASDRVAWGQVLDLLPNLDLAVEKEGISVAASVLADYDSALGQAVILALARRVGCRLGPSRVGRVLDLIRKGVSGSAVPLGARWMAELAFGRLHISQRNAGPMTGEWTLAGAHGAGDWGRWRFRWEPGQAPKYQERTGLTAWFTLAPLTVRGWIQGERVRPLGGTGRRLIVRCFQDVGVPRSRRASWPVLAHSDDILWIPGVCRSDARLPAGGTEALRVDAEYA